MRTIKAPSQEDVVKSIVTYGTRDMPVSLKDIAADLKVEVTVVSSIVTRIARQQVFIHRAKLRKGGEPAVYFYWYDELNVNNEVQRTPQRTVKPKLPKAKKEVKAYTPLPPLPPPPTQVPVASPKPTPVKKSTPDKKLERPTTFEVLYIDDDVILKGGGQRYWLTAAMLEAHRVKV